MLKFSENLVCFFEKFMKTLFWKIVDKPCWVFFENFVHKPCRVLRILLENLVWFFEIDAKIFWKSCLIFREIHENLVLKNCGQTLLGFFENFVHKPCRVLRILLENLVWFFEIDAKIFWKSCLFFSRNSWKPCFEKLLTNLVGFFEDFVHKPCRVLRIFFWKFVK